MLKYYCFSEPCYIRVEMEDLLTEKDWSPIFQPMMIFVDFVFQQLFVLDTGLCQAGSQQLCISKFTFACTCLAFCSLPMTPSYSILPAAVCIFYLSYLYSYCQFFIYTHSSHIAYFFYVISYGLNLICNIFVVEVSQVIHISEFATLDCNISQ